MRKFFSFFLAFFLLMPDFSVSALPVGSSLKYWYLSPFNNSYTFDAQNPISSPNDYIVVNPPFSVVTETTQDTFLAFLGFSGFHFKTVSSNPSNILKCSSVELGWTGYSTNPSGNLTLLDFSNDLRVSFDQDYAIVGNNALYTTMADATRFLPYIVYRTYLPSPISVETITFTTSGHALFATSDYISSDAYLISIDGSLDQIKSLLTYGFSNIDQRFLQVISAINNSAGSGGGTQAIVDAINQGNQAIQEVSDQIVANASTVKDAINSQTSVLGNKVDQQTQSLNSTLSLLDTSINNVTEELKRQGQANIDSATNDGNKVINMISQLENSVKNKWSALSYPLEFTEKIMSVFTGGTQTASYYDSYWNVSGYKYDDSSGNLVPITDYSFRNFTGGTVLTFPSFSLNIPQIGELQIWQEYSFDLSEVKDSVPVVFDAIYVISGVLMIYWLVAFLIDLFEDLINH